MFERLKEKWGVSAWQLVLILCTFAIGGSLSGILAKKVMAFVPMDKSPFWWILYIIIVTIIWPCCVLAVSIFFGQFTFFKKYILMLAKKIKLIS